MNVQEILNGIVWKDAKEQSGNSLGTLKEVFPTEEILIVKRSKTNALRATVMLKKGDKITNLICSEDLTPLVRAGRVTEEHLAGFPIIHNEKQNSLYIGFPSKGWIEVKSIKVAEYVPVAVSHDEIASSGL